MYNSIIETTMFRAFLHATRYIEAKQATVFYFRGENKGVEAQG